VIAVIAPTVWIVTIGGEIFVVVWSVGGMFVAVMRWRLFVAILKRSLSSLLLLGLLGLLPDGH
jgi:hypothetical protein